MKSFTVGVVPTNNIIPPYLRFHSQPPEESIRYAIDILYAYGNIRRAIPESTVNETANF